MKWTVGSLLDEVARGDLFRAEIYFKYRQAVDRLRTVASAQGIKAADLEALIEPLKKITPLGHGLKKLYCIYPARRMDSSLDFNETTMLGYLREGRRVAQRFIDDGRPEFSNETLADWGSQADWGSRIEPG